MGPWNHAGWWLGEGAALGDLRFGSNTAEFYHENIALPFFNHYLKDQGELDLPEAYVFETGTNQWRTFDSWPPDGVQEVSLYFHPDGRLAFDPPRQQDPEAFDEYLSDPARPVPFVNATVSTRPGGHPSYMVEDQRFAASRPDVLVYRTDVLTEDVTIAGPIAPRLFVSTSGTDSDWIVKLIDVYPDDYPDNEENPSGVRMGGYQQLVRGEVMRGKFRNSLEKPEPFIPNEVTRVEFTIPDSLHTFRKGHRIMIQIQSSWFPLVDRNPQKFVDIYSATEADFHKATQRVYRSGSRRSSVRLMRLR
jgi:putative CocE/NonD family hydrolase